MRAQSDRFQLLLFSTNVDLIRPAVEAGIDGVIVDWENVGKRERQRYFNTQINYDTLDDLKRVRRCTDALVLCRINSWKAESGEEVDKAIDAGADEILLPMVRRVSEVEQALALIDGRCKLGILIETVEAVARARALSQLPLSRIYVGLNDLAIERHSSTIFAPLADGLIEKVLEALTRPYGFGGLTLPACGFPVPCALLIGEMIRLNCSFSFLRRSFHKDMQGRKLSVEVPRLRAALASAAERSPEAVGGQRRHLMEVVKARAVQPQWRKQRCE